MWESLARYEWLVFGGLAIGLALLELRSVNRSIRQDRDALSRSSPPDDPPLPGG